MLDHSIGVKQVSISERSNSMKFTRNSTNTSVKYTAYDLSKSARSNSTLKNDRTYSWFGLSMVKLDLCCAFVQNCSVK